LNALVSAAKDNDRWIRRIAQGAKCRKKSLKYHIKLGGEGTVANLPDFSHGRSVRATPNLEGVLAVVRGGQSGEWGGSGRWWRRGCMVEAEGEIGVVHHQATSNRGDPNRPVCPCALHVLLRGQQWERWGSCPPSGSQATTGISAASSAPTRAPLAPPRTLAATESAVGSGGL
jgi:hypothetical protein